MLWMILLSTALGVQPSSRGRGAVVTLSLSLEGDAVTAGEPVFLSLHLINTSDLEVPIDLGRDLKENVAFELQTPDGRRARLSLPPWEGLGLSGRTKIRARERRSVKLLFSEWFEFSRPGRYELVATLSPDATEEDRSVVVRPSSKMVVVVGPSDPGKLAAICGRLTEEALTGDAESARAAQTLGHVRDPITIPFLGNVVQRGGTAARIEAIRGLGRAGSDAAVEALIDALERWPARSREELESAFKAGDSVTLDGSAVRAAALMELSTLEHAPIKTELKLKIRKILSATR
jgi:hypothetical protein